MPNASFPKAHRLLTRKDFEKVRGPKKGGLYLYIEIVPSSSSHLGLVVTKKYGDAHKRNRFKRVVREVYRRSFRQLKTPLDIVVRPNLKSSLVANNFSMQDIDADFKRLLHEFLPPET